MNVTKLASILPTFTVRVVLLVRFRNRFVFNALAPFLPLSYVNSSSAGNSFDQNTLTDEFGAVLLSQSLLSHAFSALKNIAGLPFDVDYSRLVLPVGRYVHPSQNNGTWNVAPLMSVNIQKMNFNYKVIFSGNSSDVSAIVPVVTSLYTSVRIKYGVFTSLPYAPAPGANGLAYLTEVNNRVQALAVSAGVVPVAGALTPTYAVAPGSTGFMGTAPAANNQNLLNYVNAESDPIANTFLAGLEWLISPVDTLTGADTNDRYLIILEKVGV